MSGVEINPSPNSTTQGQKLPHFWNIRLKKGLDPAPFNYFTSIVNANPFFVQFFAGQELNFVKIKSK